MRGSIWALLSFASLPAFAQQSQPGTVLTQYERRYPTVREDKSCKSGTRRSITTSKLTAYYNRQVVYELIEHSFCDAQGVLHIPSRTADWDFQPGQKRRFEYNLSIADHTSLVHLMNRTDVENTLGLMNAAAGGDDFTLVVNRNPLAPPQEINVMSLMLSVRFSQEYAPLFHLICKAKEMAEVASLGADPRPDWCLDLKPLPDPAP